MPDNVLHEVFLSSGHQKVSDDGLVWKEILPEGESAYTPTPAGPVKKPFRVVAEGKSDLANGVVSLEELKENFDGGALKEGVQVILGTKPPKPDGTGGDHEEITRNNTGWVRGLRIEEKPGTDSKRLMAGIEFTEPDVKDKCLRGTYANCSSGIRPFALDKHSGDAYEGAVLGHLAITNSPWVGGMEKFGGAMLSDDGVDDYVAYSLDDLSRDLANDDEGDEGDDAGEVVWDERNSAQWLREKVQGSLTALTNQAADLGQRVFFYVRDVAPIKKTALVVQESEEGGGDAFVVPFSVDGEDVKLSPTARWTQAKTVMVAAADELTDDQIRARVQNSLGYSLKLGDDYVVEEVGKHDAVVHHALTDTTWTVGWELSGNRIWLDPQNEWRRGDEVEPREPAEEPDEPSRNEQAAATEAALSDDTPEGRIAAARRQRGLLHHKNPDKGGNTMAASAKLDLSSLNLSDEQKAALEQQLGEVELSDDERSELATRRRKDREREVDDKITGLDDVGLKDNPGIKKYVRAVYMADDQEPSLNLADEDGAQPQPRSVTEVFDKFFSLLKRQADVNLSSQATQHEEGAAPPANAEGEVEDPEKDLAEAAKVLGLPIKKSRAARAAQ